MKRAGVAILAALLTACTQTVSEPKEVPSPPSSSASPSTPDDLVFAVIGDWGAGTSSQSQIASALCAQRRRTPFRDVITVGDNFYNPDGRATATNYYTPMKCVTSYPGHRWRASWGNHDVAGTSTRTVLGALHHYTWTQGEVQFIVVDSNDPAGRAQRAWLEGTLAGSRARTKIVIFHHPPYSVGGVHPPDARVRANWVPLFEKYRVTLVLNGHEHDYEHHVVNGVHYVISGGGGAFVYGCEDRDVHMIRCESVHQFLLVQLRGARLTIRAILSSGRTLDRFTVDSR